MARVIPHENDVLLGRGAVINSHLGNRRLRSLVDARRPAFALAKRKKEKRAMAMGIISEIHSLRPAGRFLIEGCRSPGGCDGAGHTSNVHPILLDIPWVEVHPDKAYDKGLHRLREKVKQERTVPATVPTPGHQLPPRRVETFDVRQTAASGSGQLAKEIDQSKGKCTDQANEEGTGRAEKTAARQDSAGKGGEWESFLGRNDIFDGEAGSLGGGDNEEDKDTLDWRGQDAAAGGNNIILMEGALLNDDITIHHDVSHVPEAILDKDLDLDSRDSAHGEHGSSQQMSEQTLRVWIKERKSMLNFDPAKSGLSSRTAMKYILSSLPVAIKLTECLIEAEKEEQRGDSNPIPVASINADNVLLRSKEVHSGERAKEVIQYAWIMSCIGDGPDVGQVIERLYSMGTVLYELFSGEERTSEHSGASFDMPSMSSMDLNNRLETSRQPQKKPLAHSEDESSRCHLRLESMGVPSSICAVVRNLLDCSKGDLCGDEAYASFTDLQTDLQLMIDDPGRFLRDISTDPMPTIQICEKLYGREEEIARLEDSYQRHFDGGCSGITISGGAGIGKSRLAIRVIQRLTNKSNSHLLYSKFNQGRDLKPFSTIGNVFDSLCDSFVRDATPAEMDTIEKELRSALGDRASIVAGITPSLFKLMPSCAESACNECVDSSLSMRFLFGELLKTISARSRPISILLDDLQFADSASLLLVGNLIQMVETNGCSVFFALCHRDDEHCDNNMFNAWLSSMSLFRFESLKLENMSSDVVNALVSDSLHLTRRLTRPLASTLHHKSRGNPLFLRRLMKSLEERGFINFSLSPRRWTWDLDRIMDLKISDDVVAFLIRQMQRLSSEQQMGLKLCACLGSTVKYSILDVISKDVGVELENVLRQLSSRGFMNNVDGKMFSFSHDKIEQAGYNMMTEQERDETHMQLGLALCAHALGNDAANDELFFAALKQVNRGGPDTVHDDSQKSILAELNLRGGRRAIEVANYGAANAMFEHGISFLRRGHWATDYRLSIDLFDAAADSASALNKRKEVAFYSDQMVQHAKCFDEKVNCLFAVIKSLRNAHLLKDSMESTFAIIQQLGEDIPVEMGDEKLNTDIERMNSVLRNTPDDTILNMDEIADTKTVILLKIYANLADLLHFAKPSLVGAVSHRMVEITMKNGLSGFSAITFCLYGEILTACGNLSEGCRLGRLALKLCGKAGSSRYKSFVFCFVYQTILWISEPIQSVADAHVLGQKAGQQAGDFLYTSLKWHALIGVYWVSGKRLDIVQSSIRDFIREMEQKNARFFIPNSILIHSSSIALREGLHILDGGRVDDDIPTEKELFADPKLSNDRAFVIGHKVHLWVRKFLFHKFDEGPPDMSILDEFNQQQYSLRPIHMWGLFFEGLASYRFARQTDESIRWIRNGDSILAMMKHWSEHSSWNWENKILLLEAERSYTLGNSDNAATFYMDSIKSAHKQKFVHEEAIASELAGVFFHTKGLPKEAVDFSMHSIWNYKKWGATALAKKVESFIASNYSVEFNRFEQGTGGSKIIFADERDPKKRQGNGRLW